ncbi:MAG: GNAT family N-acetyltransferase [Solirubrobacteraceae bacterium]
MTAIVETERLTLREFHRGDLDELAAMLADKEQMQFYPRARTRDEASTWLGRNLVLYRKRRFGMWAIESGSTSVFLGYCGIRPLVVDGACEVEIGWHVQKAAWNRGIATEAAAAVREIACGRFGISRLVALIHPDHVASRRVAEKVGMHESRPTIFDGEPFVIYTASVRDSSRQGSAAAQTPAARARATEGSD